MAIDIIFNYCYMQVTVLRFNCQLNCEFILHLVLCILLYILSLAPDSSNVAVLHQVWIKL
jgi:hypothetical protein